MLFVIVAFALNEGAYNSETIRAAIQSVDKGQIEAANVLLIFVILIIIVLLRLG